MVGVLAGPISGVAAAVFRRVGLPWLSAVIHPGNVDPHPGAGIDGAVEGLPQIACDELNARPGPCRRTF
jgi:hypothetical protein